MRACKYDVLREVWKSVAVPSVMYGMEVLAWNENEIDKLEVGQNRIAMIALNAPIYAAVEALRGDMGWSTFRERFRKASIRYKIRLERLDNARLARKVYLWSLLLDPHYNSCCKAQMWLTYLNPLQPSHAAVALVHAINDFFFFAISDK